MSVYAYLRVSTDSQDVNTQKIGIEEFCAAKDWQIAEWIMDEGVSGAKEPSKRKLGGLLKKCQRGDAIVFSEISRIGRKLVMILDVIKSCGEKGVKIYTVKDRYVLEDTIQSKVLVTVMGLAAEIERDLLRQRTKEGLARARLAGKTIGRPRGVGNTHHKLDGKAEYIAGQLAAKVPLGKIARSLRVHPITIVRWRRKCGI
jgi:DNA invertase Pin-like site-specific DNA recombinase